MGVAVEAPKDSAVYDVPDLTSCVDLGQGVHAFILVRIVWRKRKKWTSVCPPPRSLRCASFPCDRQVGRDLV